MKEMEDGGETFTPKGESKVGNIRRAVRGLDAHLRL